MKYHFPIVLLLLFVSCTNAPKHVPPAPSVHEVPSPKSCFLLLQGISSRDSTFLSLDIQGNRVSGTLNWIPSGKDARKGTVSGVRNGDLIKGTWTFMQEGMNDTLAVAFKLIGAKLYQQGYSVDQATGREYLDSTGSFNLEFKKVACKN